MSTCTRCSKPIASTVFEPIVAVGRGTFHYDCFVADAGEARTARATRAAATSAKRRQLMLARHAERKVGT